MASPRAADIDPIDQAASVRGLPVVRRVLAAVLDELAAVGYTALSVEQVARRAGVNKTTVYRRWPTKAELVTAALEAKCADAPPLQETGDVRADLLALAVRMAASLSTPRGRGLLRTVVAGCSEELYALARENRRRNEAALVRLLERAIGRGELRAGVDPAMLVHVVSGWLVHTILRERAEPTEAQLRALVDLLLDGAAPRISRRPSRAAASAATRTRPKRQAEAHS